MPVITNRNTGDSPGFSVAHISPSYGGVATAAKRLHLGLLRIGVSSTFFVTDLPGPDAHLQHIVVRPCSSRFLHYADILSRLIDNRLGLTGMTHISSLFWSFSKFDVIHLHGMDSAWFNLHALSRLNRDHLLVWTMHDKHLGTGACGYPEMWGNCERWRIGCGKCPKAEAHDWLMDCTGFVYARKKKILSSTDLAVVAPSQWMLDFVSSNPLTTNQTLRLIPYGVDTDSFVPLSAAQCRADLELPVGYKLLLAVADHLGQPRKGLQYFQSLVRHLKTTLKENDLGLVLVGSQLPADVLTQLRAVLSVYTLGRIDDIGLLAKAYNAVDLFVILSMVDNSPSVVLESLACGTPVAGFRVGGIPDMVRPGQTGVLAELGDTADLAWQIHELLIDDNKLTHMRRVCRESAVQNYDLTLQGTRYAELYSDLAAERRCKTTFIPKYRMVSDGKDHASL